ncbi:hypothetical protein FS749_008719, partial [Ceratobasidium sp. UAMH 11750]
DVERALQTVAAGRKAENLLDFDDPAPGTGATNSLANLNLTTSPAAILTSSNPLADLADIFGGDSMNLNSASAVMSPIAGSPSVGGNSMISPIGGGGGFGSMGGLTPQPQQQQQKPQQASDDLLGLF